MSTFKTMAQQPLESFKRKVNVSQKTEDLTTVGALAFIAFMFLIASLIA